MADQKQLLCMQGHDKLQQGGFRWICMRLAAAA